MEIYIGNTTWHLLQNIFIYLKVNGNLKRLQKEQNTCPKLRSFNIFEIKSGNSNGLTWKYQNI